MTWNSWCHQRTRIVWTPHPAKFFFKQNTAILSSLLGHGWGNVFVDCCLSFWNRITTLWVDHSSILANMFPILEIKPVSISHNAEVSLFFSRRWRSTVLILSLIVNEDCRRTRRQGCFAVRIFSKMIPLLCLCGPIPKFWPIHAFSAGVRLCMSPLLSLVYGTNSHDKSCRYNIAMDMPVSEIYSCRSETVGWKNEAHVDFFEASMMSQDYCKEQKRRGGWNAVAQNTVILRVQRHCLDPVRHFTLHCESLHLIRSLILGPLKEMPKPCWICALCDRNCLDVARRFPLHDRWLQRIGILVHGLSSIALDGTVVIASVIQDNTLNVICGWSTDHNLSVWFLVSHERVPLSLRTVYIVAVGEGCFGINQALLLPLCHQRAV